MDIEKLLIAILLSLISLLGISVMGILIVACVSWVDYIISIGQYFSLIGILLVLLLFIYLVSYFYKNVES